MDLSNSSDLDTYLYVYNWLLFVISLFYSIFLYSRNGTLHKPNYAFVSILILVVSLFIGSCPITIGSDKHLYLLFFQKAQASPSVFIETIFEGKDIGWNIYTYVGALCMNSQFWFFVTAFIYVLGFYKFSKTFFSNYQLVAFLLFLNSFLFFSYGCNTIRSGVATCILFIAFCYYKRSFLKFLILAFISIQIHGSMLLPIVIFCFMRYYQKPKILFYVWLISIPLSAILGHTVENLLSPFFEERSGFLTATDDSYLYKTGFRIDFILYSVFPVLIGYYWIIKKNFRDPLYIQFFETYLMANTFWILVIQTNFSDRIAYLSWMFYPLLLAYPYAKGKLNFKIKNQMLSLFLLGEAVFRMIIVLK